MRANLVAVWLFNYKSKSHISSFLNLNFFGAQIILDLNFFDQHFLDATLCDPNIVDLTFFSTQILLHQILFRVQKCFDPNSYGQSFFGPYFFGLKILLDLKFSFDTKYYFIQKFLDNKYFWTQNISWPKIFGSQPKHKNKNNTIEWVLAQLKLT